MESRIRKKMEQKEVTMVHLSQRTGIRLSSLSRIVNGYNMNPTLQTAATIAKELGTTIDWLFKYHIENSIPKKKYKPRKNKFRERLMQIKKK